MSRLPLFGSILAVFVAVNTTDYEGSRSPSSDIAKAAQPAQSVSCSGDDPTWFIHALGHRMVGELDGSPVYFKPLNEMSIVKLPGKTTVRAKLLKDVKEFGLKKNTAIKLELSTPKSGSCLGSIDSSAYPYEVKLTLPNDFYYTGCCRDNNRDSSRIGKSIEAAVRATLDQIKATQAAAISATPFSKQLIDSALKNKIRVRSFVKGRKAVLEVASLSRDKNKSNKAATIEFTTERSIRDFVKNVRSRFQTQYYLADGLRVQYDWNSLRVGKESPVFDIADELIQAKSEAIRDMVFEITNPNIQLLSVFDSVVSFSKRASFNEVGARDSKFSEYEIETYDVRTHSDADVLSIVNEKSLINKLIESNMFKKILKSDSKYANYQELDQALAHVDRRNQKQFSGDVDDEESSSAPCKLLSSGGFRSQFYISNYSKETGLIDIVFQLDGNESPGDCKEVEKQIVLKGIQTNSDVQEKMKAVPKNLYLTY